MVPLAMSNPLDAPCHMDLVDMKPFGIVLGLLLTFGCAVGCVPALVKPIKMKSTLGVSPACLVLTNFQQVTTLVNTLILKWPQVKQCADKPLGCQPSMIQIYTTAVAAFILFPQHLLTVYYPHPPEAQSWNRLMWYLQVVLCGGLLVVSIIWSSYSDCGSDNALRLFGIWNGLISSVLIVFRFMPQVYVTIKTRSSGAISYIFYFVIGVGGFMQTYFSIVQSHEELTIWLPVFVANCFQTLILILCIFYDFVLPKRQDPNALESVMLVRSGTASIGRSSQGRESVAVLRSSGRRSRTARPSLGSQGRPSLGSQLIFASQPSQHADAPEAPVIDASGGYIVTPAATLEELVQSVASRFSRTSRQQPTGFGLGERSQRNSGVTPPRQSSHKPGLSEDTNFDAGSDNVIAQPTAAENSGDKA
jgi:cystinosin